MKGEQKGSRNRKTKHVKEHLIKKFPGEAVVSGKFTVIDKAAASLAIGGGYPL